MMNAAAAPPSLSVLAAIIVLVAAVCVPISSGGGGAAAAAFSAPPTTTRATAKTAPDVSRRGTTSHGRAWTTTPCRNRFWDPVGAPPSTAGRERGDGVLLREGRSGVDTPPSTPPPSSSSSVEAFNDDIFRVASRSSASSPSVEAAVRAESMLRRMLELYGESGGRANRAARPNVSTFELVLGAYANLGRSRWRDRRDGNGNGGGGGASVEGTGRVPSRAGMVCAADRAEELHASIEGLYASEGHPDELRPTTAARNLLLRSYASCAGPSLHSHSRTKDGKEGFAERALKVLRGMEEVRDEAMVRDVPGGPDVESYALVIEAFARQQGRPVPSSFAGAAPTTSTVEDQGGVNVDPTYASLASVLLSELETSYKILSKGDPDARSSLVVAYREVLGAWARCGARGSAGKADDILRRWEGLLMDEEIGDDDCDGDNSVTNAVNGYVEEGPRNGEADPSAAGESNRHGEDTGSGEWKELDDDFDWRSRTTNPYGFDEVDDDDDAGGTDTRNAPPLAPAADTYTSLILAYAQSRGEPGSALRAHDLLEECCVVYESGAWDGGGDGDSKGEVVSIDSSFESSHDWHSRHRCQPDPVAFNAAIAAWGRSPSPEGAERAEEVLDMMATLCEEFPPDYDHDHDYDDDYDDYNFEEEEEGEEQEEGGAVGIYDYLRPDAVSYNSAIAAWTRRADGGNTRGGGSPATSAGIGGRDAMDRAEALLRRMEEDVAVEEHDDDEEEHRNRRRSKRARAKRAPLPDAYTYSTLLHGHARLGGPDAADRAEGHLRSMERRFLREGDRSGCKPDVRAYSAVVAAHGRGGRSEGAERALEVLRRMGEVSAAAAAAAAEAEAEAEADDKPWKEAKEDGGRRVDNSLEPDAVLYTAVIDAFGRAAHPDGAATVMNLLDELERKYEASASTGGGGSSSKSAAARALLPTSRTYCSALSALASCRSPGNDRRAREVLARMGAMYRTTGDERARPTARAYNCAINAAANTLGDVRTEKREAFKMALESFVELRRLHSIAEAKEVETGKRDGDSGKTKGRSKNAAALQLRPDGYTYAFFLKACCSLLPLGTFRSDVMARTVRECCRDGMLTDEALGRVQRGMAPEAVRELLDGTMMSTADDDDGEKGGSRGTRGVDYRTVRAHQLPSGWSRNTRAGAGFSGGRRRAAPPRGERQR